MSIQDAWEKALKTTEFVRPRVAMLAAVSVTHLPYVFLAESVVNRGDTVVRKGEVLVEKPSIIMPSHHPKFKGFEFEDNEVREDSLTNFLLVRGVSFPSMKYNNKTSSLDLFEGPLEKAIRLHMSELERSENVHTSLFTGSEDIWQFSVLLYVCSQVARSAQSDIARLLDEHKRKGRLS